jgi:hypothetical protein
LPVALIVGSATGPNSWLTWGAIFAVEFVVVGLFMLLDEVNENVRFVRHQLGALRFAVRRVGAEVASYKDPVANFALSDAVTALNREWEDPK